MVWFQCGRPFPSLPFPTTRTDAALTQTGAHTLPHTQLLLNFPCQGSVWNRASYLLSRSPLALRDMLYYTFPDTWGSYGNLVLLLRLPAMLLLPTWLYEPFGCAITYFGRLLPLLVHLWLGPNIRPGLAAQWYFLSNQPACELLVHYPSLPVGSSLCPDVCNHLYAWKGSRQIKV